MYILQRSWEVDSNPIKTSWKRELLLGFFLQSLPGVEACWSGCLECIQGSFFSILGAHQITLFLFSEILFWLSRKQPMLSVETVMFPWQPAWSKELKSWWHNSRAFSSCHWPFLSILFVALYATIQFVNEEWLQLETTARDIFFFRFYTLRFRHTIQLGGNLLSSDIVGRIKFAEDSLCLDFLWADLNIASLKRPSDIAYLFSI